MLVDKIFQHVWKSVTFVAHNVNVSDINNKIPIYMQLNIYVVSEILKLISTRLKSLLQQLDMFNFLTCLIRLSINVFKYHDTMSGTWRF